MSRKTVPGSLRRVIRKRMAQRSTLDNPLRLVSLNVPTSLLKGLQERYPSREGARSPIRHGMLSKTLCRLLEEFLMRPEDFGEITRELDSLYRSEYYGKPASRRTRKRRSRRDPDAGGTE